jgi:hypothetical protein
MSLENAVERIVIGDILQCFLVGLDCLSLAVDYGFEQSSVPCTQVDFEVDPEAVQGAATCALFCGVDAPSLQKLPRQIEEKCPANLGLFPKVVLILLRCGMVCKADEALLAILQKVHQAGDRICGCSHGATA